MQNIFKDTINKGVKMGVYDYNCLIKHHLCYFVGEGSKRVISMILNKVQLQYGKVTTQVLFERNRLYLIGLQLWEGPYEKQSKDLCVSNNF